MKNKPMLDHQALKTAFVGYFPLNKILHISSGIRDIKANQPSVSAGHFQGNVRSKTKRGRRPRIPLTSVQSLPVHTPHHNTARFSTQKLAPV